MPCAGVDAQEADVFWELERGLELGGLAEEAEELVFLAEETSHLVHDAAGGAGDLVFDLLAETRDGEGGELNIEVGEEVEHGGDFEGGGGTDAGAHGDGAVEGEVEAFDVRVAEVEEILVVEDVEAAGNVGGPFSAGGVEVAAEGVDGGGGEGVEGDAEGEREMLVEEVEGEDLELAIGALLESDGDGAVEG
jgi:hypothetical protein